MHVLDALNDTTVPLVGAAVVLLASHASAAPRPRNLDVCVSITSTSGLVADLPAAYCASDQGIKAVVGRNRSITLELRHNQPRRLVLTLGARLADALDDPDPNADGGEVDQTTPGDWSEHVIPTLPAAGVFGTFQVGYLVNVLLMGEPGQEPNPNDRNARLYFEDAGGEDWVLLWGPHRQPGGYQRTNPWAPAVRIERLTDGSDLINEWDVMTQEEIVAPGRAGSHSAFLYRVNGPSPGDDDYWGAFDVSVAFDAVEE